MSGMFAAAAAGVRTIGLQTPECGIAELWRCWIVTRRVAKLPECEAVGPRTFGMKRRRSTEPLGSEPPECSIAELWRCWIVTRRVAKLPECEAAARRVERPAPGAVSSGRDADAPSRLPLPGHKCSPSFFPGGFAPIPTHSRPDSRSSQPVLAGFALFTTLSRPDSRPSQPAPGPNSHAARTVPAPPERQSRRACDSAGESPGQRCKGGVTQGIPTGEARSRRGIGPYGTVSAGAGPTARQPAKTGRRTRRTTPTRGLPTGTEETTRQRRSGSRPLCRQLVDKMSKDVETRR